MKEAAVAYEMSNVYSAMYVLLGRRRKSFYLLVVLQLYHFQENPLCMGGFKPIFFAVVLNSSQGEFCSPSLLLNQAGEFQTDLKRTD